MNRGVEMSPERVLVMLILVLVAMVIGIGFGYTQERNQPWLLVLKAETCIALAHQRVALAAGEGGQCTLRARYQGVGLPSRTHVHLELLVDRQWMGFDVLAEQVLSKRPL